MLLTTPQICGRVDQLPAKVANLDYVYILAGLVGLFMGGEALVRGSVSIARRMAISPLLIGLTVVGFGTSTPELLVSLDAAWRGVPEIAVGNIVGSNIANILLIVGLTAVTWPIKAAGATLRRDTAVMMAAALILIPVFAMGHLERPTGLLMVSGLAVYLFWAYRQPGEAVLEDVQLAAPTSYVVPTLWVVGGFIATSRIK